MTPYRLLAAGTVKAQTSDFHPNIFSVDIFVKDTV